MGYPSVYHHMPVKFGEPSSSTYAFAAHYPRYPYPAPRALDVQLPPLWKSTATSRPYVQPALAPAPAASYAHELRLTKEPTSVHRTIVADHSASSLPLRPLRRVAHLSVTVHSPARSDATLDSESPASPPAVHVVCNAPLVAPKPLPYHSPTFLQFDLPDDDEDLSHPPYVSRPHKRKRPQHDEDGDEDAAARDAIAMKRRASDDRRGRWHPQAVSSRPVAQQPCVWPAHAHPLPAPVFPHVAYR